MLTVSKTTYTGEAVGECCPGPLECLYGRLRLLRDRVTSVARSYQTAAYLVGRPGTGKTYTVKEELTRLGVPWAYANARMSPMGLFMFLAEHPEHVLVLDDISTLFGKDEALQILMAALDGVPGQPRRVSYKTKDARITVEFRGGIIAISNLPLHNDPLARALGSRIVVLEHEPADEELLAFMYRLAAVGHQALSPEEAGDVLAFLVGESRSAGLRLDLRHLDKACRDYRQCRAGDAASPWQELVRTSLQQTPASSPAPPTKREEIEAQRRLVKELVTRFPKDSCRQLAESGLSKSTFYARRREVLGAS